MQRPLNLNNLNNPPFKLKVPKVVNFSFYNIKEFNTAEGSKYYARYDATFTPDQRVWIGKFTEK